MKSRQTFIQVIVAISLFLILFSALSIAVLYIGQSTQNNNPTAMTGSAIQGQISGDTLVIDDKDLVNNSGEAVQLPQGN